MKCSCPDVSSTLLSSSSSVSLMDFTVAGIETMNQEKQMIANFVENFHLGDNNGNNNDDDDDDGDNGHTDEQCH